MEYLVTFDDGSSAYLSHYGVKGMKRGKHIMAKDPAYLASLGLGPAPTKMNGEDYGFNNTVAGRKAAYDEAGFNRKWSREKGMAVAKKNFQERLKPSRNAASNPNTRIFSAVRQLKNDIRMASTLKTRAQKKMDRNRKY